MSEFSFFHKQLDEQYPIGELIDPSLFDQINWGEEELFLNLRGTTLPLTSVEAFLLLKELLRNSIEHGRWEGMKMPDDEILHFESKGVFDDQQIGTIAYSTEFMLTTRRLQREGYLEFGEIMKSHYYGPTEKLVKFYQELTQALR